MILASVGPACRQAGVPVSFVFRGGTYQDRRSDAKRNAQWFAGDFIIPSLPKDGRENNEDTILW